MEKPGLVSMPFALMETTGIWLMPAFFKGTADKAYVVGGAASASGLGHKDGCTV